MPAFNTEALFAAWSAQIPTGVPVDVMNKMLFLAPQLQSATITAAWEKISDIKYKCTFLVLGEPGYYILLDVPENVVIIEISRLIMAYYIPIRIIDAIKELCPAWTKEGSSYVTPVKKILQVVKSTLGIVQTPQGNDSIPGATIEYIITFDNPSITAESLKETAAYKYPQMKCNNMGVIQ